MEVMSYTVIHWTVKKHFWFTKVKTSDQLTGLVNSIDGSHNHEAIGSYVGMKVPDIESQWSLSQHPPLLHLPPVGLLLAPPLVLGLELIFTTEPAIPHGPLQSSLGPVDVPPGQLDGDEHSLPPLDDVKQGLLSSSPSRHRVRLLPTTGSSFDADLWASSATENQIIKCVISKNW